MAGGGEERRGEESEVEKTKKARQRERKREGGMAGEALVWTCSAGCYQRGSLVNMHDWAVPGGPEPVYLTLIVLQDSHLQTGAD